MGTLLATLAIFLTWALFLIVLIGVGRLASRPFLRNGAGGWPLSNWAWMGLAAVVLWAFLIHMVVPLTSPVALVPIALASIVGWSLGGPTGSRTGPLVRGLRSRDGLVLGLTGLAAGVALCIANFSLGVPENYDSYLYHFASIQHYSNYPVIEGLANLHYRFGFQSATLPLAALLEIGLLPGEGFRMVNGLLFFLVGFSLLERAAAVLEDQEITPGTAFLFFASVIFFFAPGSVDPGLVLASPSVDTGTALALLLAMAAFIDAVCDGMDRVNVLVALSVAGLAAAFRPQSLVFLAVVCLVLGFLWARSRRSVGSLVVMLVPVALLSGAWMIHSILVSGHPIFPSRFADIGLPWAVPASTIGDASGLITRHGARSGGPLPMILSEPGGFFSWFESWIDYLRSKGFLFRLATIFTAAVLALGWILRSNDSRRDLGLLGVLMLPAVASLLFWFLTAPLLRYGLGPVVAVSALLVSVAVFGLRRRTVKIPTGTGLSLIALGAFLLVSVVAVDYGTERFGLVVRASGDGPLGVQEPRAAKLRKAVLPGGVWVWTPVDGSKFCGEEFRCTPEPFRGIKFRGDRLEDGLEPYP